MGRDVAKRLPLLLQYVGTLPQKSSEFSSFFLTKRSPKRSILGEAMVHRHEPRNHSVCALCGHAAKRQQECPQNKNLAITLHDSSMSTWSDCITRYHNRLNPAQTRLVPEGLNPKQQC
jgi:hypothetical protein